VTHACSNGLASRITFAPVNVSAPVPKQLIVSLAYNTETYGAAPTGEEGPVNSLNVALSESWKARSPRAQTPRKGCTPTRTRAGCTAAAHRRLTPSPSPNVLGPEGGYQPVIEVQG